MNKLILNVSNNEAYSPDDIKNPITLSALLDAVQDAISQYGEDATVVTHDSGNRFGANFGSIPNWGDLFTTANPDAEEDEDEL